MSPEAGDIRRLDVGHGIYVRATSGGSPTPEDDAARRRIPPVAVVACVLLGAASLVRTGVTAAGVLAAALLVVLAVLAAIDARARVLPNRIVGPAIGGALAWQLAFFPAQWVEWVGAGLGAGAFLVVPGLLRPGAVGLGDVKLAVLLGIALGAAVVPAIVLALVAAVPAALVQLARAGRGATMPYGPFLALGAAIVLLA
jgi:leader peptidase (prepilin peptidase) / N-methyltransferase